MTSSLPPLNQAFEMVFAQGHVARAVCLQPGSAPSEALQSLELERPQPAIFVIGGAAKMSREDQDRTNAIIGAVAAFAQEHHAVIIDGGTEAGIMQMVGDARLRGGHTFPLIGVAPVGKISYPGYNNPDEEAFLQDSHTHFVLVNGQHWGDESEMLLNLAHYFGQISQQPAVGVLINGGRVAMQEVYLASTRSPRLPVIVLEGSGRAADELAAAMRGGATGDHLMQVILVQGDLEVVALNDGPAAVVAVLARRFNWVP